MDSNLAAFICKACYKDWVIQCVRSQQHESSQMQSSGGSNPDLTEIVIYYYLEISTNPYSKACPSHRITLKIVGFFI